MPNKKLAPSIVEPESLAFGLVSDFSWTIAKMFLETFLSSKTKLTAKEKKTIQDCLSILKKYLEKKI